MRLTPPLLVLLWSGVAAAQDQPAQPPPQQPAQQQPAQQQPAQQQQQPAQQQPAAAPQAEEEEDLEDDELAVEPPMVMPEFGKVVGPPRRVRHRWVWDNITAGRVNPLGATNRFNTGYRLQIWDRPGDLFEQSFFYLGYTSELTPAFYQMGGKISIQPLAILNLSAAYEYHGTFGVWDNTRSFQSPAEEHDDDTLEDTRILDYGTQGSVLTLGALLQAKVWRIAARSHFQAYRYNLNLRNGDNVFYNKTLDIMVDDGNWAITNDADLIFLTDFGLKIAARHTFTHAFYSEGMKGGAADENTPTHRIGPAFVQTIFTDREGARWNEVSIVLLAQWWVKHRYRTGENVHQGIPYALLALVQRGDFYP